MDGIAELLSTYAKGLRYSDLTRRAIHAAKRSIVDSMGCALSALAARPMQALCALAGRVSATSPATVIGTNIRTSPEWAALVNGALVRYRDFSDDYFGGKADVGPHPSDNIGSIMAAVESSALDGRALVLGTVLTYEIGGRLTDQFSIYRQGWDYTILHAISSSLAVGRVLDLTDDQMRNALGIAVVSNVALAQTRHGEISNWKGIAGPNASRCGLTAALLAKEGITGPRAPFEGRAGLMKQLNHSFELSEFGGADTDFKIEGTFFKNFPVRYETQLPIEIALGLRRDVEVDEIASITVFTESSSVVDRIGNPDLWDPMGRETADHSAPYLIAAALVDGAITDATFTPERYRDNVILALTDKIRMVEDPGYTANFPVTMSCRFEIALKSGRALTVQQQNPKGHPANAMTDQDINGKFMKLVQPILGDRRSEELMDVLWRIDDLKDMASMFSLATVPR
jgi:2-methylcitrate dehydratase